ncbi:MAG: hypothetical protein WEC84_03860 [Candidatus Andersenbacteria bacterium]
MSEDSRSLEQFWEDVRHERWAEVGEWEAGGEEKSTIDDFIALGIDPRKPAEGKPGDVFKVLVLAARYVAGLELWRADDATFEAPEETLLFTEEMPADELLTEDYDMIVDQLSVRSA